MKKLLRTLLLLAALVVPWATQAQTLESYGFTTGVDSSKWVDMTSSTQILTPSNSDGMASAIQNIGFSFPFGNTTYTQYSVNTDGNLRLGGTVASTSYYTTPFSSTYASQNNPKINAFGCDGYGVSGSHYVKAKIHETTDGDTLLVVEFCTGTYTSATRDNLYKWQIHLYTNGNIDIVFPSASGIPSVSPAVAHQCGICANSSDGWVIQSATNSATHFTNGSTLTNASGTWFDANRYYSFIHPSNISCPAPLGATASNITTSDATISWHRGGTETAWELKVDDISYYPSDTFYTVTNLNGNTVYGAYVRAICGVGDTSFASSCSFRTACVPLTANDLPYSEDFESYESGSANPIDPCWHKGVVALTGSGTTTNFPYPYSTAAINGSRGLYFYAATTSSTSYYNWLVLPPIDASLNMSDLTVEFMMKRTATASHQTRLVVGVTTDYTSTAGFVPVDTIDLSSAATSSVHSVEVNFANYTGAGTYVLFYAPAPTSATTYNAFYVDDITLKVTPTCFRPTEVEVSDIDVDGAVVSWTPDSRTSSPTSWTVEYDIAGFTPGEGNTVIVNDTFVTLYNLLANTAYDVYVSANCGGDISETRFHSFRTACVAIDNLPYSENFDGMTGSTATAPTASYLPPCWNYFNNGTRTNYMYCPYVYSSTTYSHSGSNCIRFYSYNTSGDSTQYLILPIVDTNSYPVSTLQVSFWLRAYSTSSTYHADVVVGVMPDPTDESSFVPCATFGSTSTTYAQYSHEFSQYTGPNGCIALKFPKPTTSSNYEYGYVDDVVVDLIPTCFPPTDLVVTSISTDEAEISWTPNVNTPSPNGWVVEYDLHGFTPGDGTSTTVTDTAITIINLMPNTEYDIYVNADCGGGDESTPVILTFRTLCDNIDSLPYTQDFETAATGTATTATFVNCMTRLNNGTQYFGYPYVGGSTYNHTANGTKGLYWYNAITAGTYGDYQIVVLPGVDTINYPINTLQLSFWARPSSTSYSPQFQVGVMTNPYDPSTFQQVDVVHVSNTTTWQEFTTMFGSFTGTGNYVAIRALRPASAWYAYLDDITLDVLPPCPNVLSHHVTTTVSSACIRWNVDPNFGFSPDNYEIRYGFASDSLNNATTITQSDSVLTLTGLDADTAYVVSIRTVCSGVTGPAYTFNFSTHALPCVAWDTTGGGPTDTITVGTPGTSTTDVMPLNQSYNYSYCQFIVLASEVAFNGPATISGIAFDYSGTVTMTHATTCSLYVANTTRNSMATGDPFVPYNQLQLVYVGPMNCTPSGWNYFQFNQGNLQYDGTSNLVVAIVDNSGSSDGSGATFRYQQISGTALTHRVYGSTPYGPTEMDAATANASFWRSNMRFVTGGGDCIATATCVAPAVTLDIDSVGDLAFSWLTGYQENSWDLDYRVAGTTAWTNVLTNTTLTEYTIQLNTLQPMTEYEFRVMSNCSDTNVGATVTYITPCAALQVPYTEDFESYGSGATQPINPCWVKGTSSSTAYPYPYSTNVVNGTRSLYFYGNYPSSTSSTPIYSYAALPMFSAPLDTLMVSFSIRRYNSTSTYYTTHMLVGVMTDPSDISTFVGVDTIDLYNEQPGSIHNFEVPFDSYTGNGRYIAFYDPVPPLHGSNTYAYSYVSLDDITVDYIPSCRRILDVNVLSTTQTTATINWVDLNNAGNGYEIEYGPEGFAHGTGTIITSIDTVETLTGLTVSTGYDFYVRPLCSATEAGPWSFVTNFRTVCGIYTVPFVEDFESYGTGSGEHIDPCWSKGTSSSTAYPYPYSTNAITGSRSLYFYGYQPSSATTTPIYSYVALPEFNVSVDSLELSFKVRTYSTASTYYYTYLLVGVMSNPNDINTFVGVDTINLQGQAALSVHDVVVDFSGYTGTGTHIAIYDPVPPLQGTNTYAYSYAYVDDINVDMASPCGRPHNLQASVTSSTIDLSWTDTVNATQWQIEYGPSGFALGTGTILNVSQNPYTITGLTPSTLYDVYVRSYCPGGGMGGNNPGIFTVSTSQVAATVPYYYNFENAAEWANWQTVSNNSVNWYRGTAEAAEGSYGLYVSTDSGATCNSLHSTITNAAVYRDIDFGSTPSSFEMTFLAKSAGVNDGNYEGINVMLVDPTLPVAASGTALTSPWGSFNVVHVVRDTNWQAHTLLFDSISGVKRVVFNWYTSTTASHPVWEGAGAIDSIVIMEQSCIRPNNTTVTNIGPNYVSLHWDGDANATYVVRLREFNTTANIDNVTNTNSITVNNLTPMTHYYVWVYKMCDTNNFSYSAPRIEFATTCGLISASDTLFEDFNAITGTSYSTAGVLPDCWEGYSNGTNAAYMPHVTDGSTYSYSVTGNPITMTSGSATYGDTKIVRLPKFAEPVNSLTLSYWYCTESSTNGTLYVGYMTGFNYETDFVPIVAHPASTASYHSGNGPQAAGHGIFDTVSFDTVPSNALFIAFKWVYNTSFYSVCIDNVEVTSTGSYCAAPDVVVSNIDYNQATLNWTGNATDYEVSYKMASEGTWPDETAVSANSYNLTNLQPATTYQFRVRAICDTAEGMISDWTTGTFVTDSLPCFAPSELEATPSYVSVTLDWEPGTSETMWNVHIWNSTKDTVVTVNAHPAVVGGLAQTTAYYAAVQALCGSGAAESDYSDTIQFTTNTCAAPTGVAVSNVTNTTAVVTWNGNAASYDISYGERGFGEGQGEVVTGVTGNTYTITGLEPDMAYDVYVRANCEAGVPSGWSENATFTTTNEGIHAADGGLNVTIYPNPTTSATTISLSGVNGEVEITIVDMNGRTVKSDVMSCDGDCAKKLTVDGLAAGAYFVRISADGINAVKKLVVK